MDANGQRSPLADDLLRSAMAIADYLGWPERVVRYQIERGRLPTFKVGAAVCARKSELDAALRARPELEK